MKDKKLRILLSILSLWLFLFLLTLGIKAPLLEGVDVALLVGAILWLAYWSLSLVRNAVKPKQTTTTNAPKTKITQ